MSHKDWNDAYLAGVNAREAADAEWAEQPKPNGNSTALISRCASEIKPERVEWLWPGRIAVGKHTCIAGEPGTGKSQLSIAITAAITMGGEWPCGEGCAPIGSVIILSAEDGEADTIVPRLLAAGADLGRVHIISAVRTDAGVGRRGFNLQADLELLENKIAEIGDVVLIVIDPVSSYLGKTDSHKNSEVRGVLEPLSAMAERTRVAVLSITHFSKAGVGAATKALHRFIGSIAFVGAPRAAFAVIEDTDDRDRRLFLHAKNNLAPPPQGLAFRLEQTIVGETGEGIVASRVKWERDPVSMTANDALMADAGSGESRTAKEEADAFLLELLAGGPVSAKEVKRQAEETGVSVRTLKRSKHSLGVEARREGGIAETGQWLWALPKGANGSLRGPSQNLAPLVPLDDFRHFSDAEVPKGANHESGPLSEPDGAFDAGFGGDGDPFASPKDASRKLRVEGKLDDYPDLPEFLDRRAAQGS
jgi:putative DNA primase/helicase